MKQGKYEKYWALGILVLVAFAALIVRGKPIRVAHFTVLGTHDTKYGLDIKGGARVILQARPDLAPPGTPYNDAQIVDILEHRINAVGVAEAVVQPRPQQKQFIVELPEVKNKNQVLAMIGTTAQMTFYYFNDVASSESKDPSVQGRPVQAREVTDLTGRRHMVFFDQRTGRQFRDGAAIKADWDALLSDARANAADAGNTPYAPPADNPAQAQVLGPAYDRLSADTPVSFTAAQQARATALNQEIGDWNALLSDALNANGGKPVLTGAELLPNSRAELSGPEAAPAVTQEFNPSGAKKYADFTTAHTGEIVGIVLDDSALSAPYIVGPILDGAGQISGGFSNLSEAQSLADLLNAGALPIPLKQVYVESVDPSLGKGAVSKSLVAGAAGLALVLLFMAAYYRLPGLVADIALLIYALFALAIFKGALNWLFPGLVVTLTLPGIAGFILSIGMAVDANILIFERLKEELRSGKALRPAIDAAFKRAFSAIRDSNICTCITCVVLLSLGTASVRGFALTLLIGVLVSLFTAVTVTRTLLYLLVDAGVGNNVALFGLNVRAPRPGEGGAAIMPNIIGRRRFFYGLSLAIIVPGLVFLLFLHGLKPSIEFTGGTQIEVKYARPVSQGDVARSLAAQGFHDSTVQMAEGGTTAIVSVPDAYKGEDPDKGHNPVYQKLTAGLNALGPNMEQQFGLVGSVISTEVTSNAFQAVVIASLLIVLYLATVFGIGGFVAGLRLGTSAIVALLHDVLVLLGAFAIFGYFLGWQIDSLFITALLTVIGFSVHDTVVIFDRVRENLRHKARAESFESLVNRSIGQTLTRSVFTSLTVLLTLACLIIFGGQTTRLLNTALFIGILSGTYSSIFNAASILVDWENWLAKRRANAPVYESALPAPAPSTGGAAIYPANGGSTRPPAARPRPPAAPRPAAPGEVQISAIRAKKKRPAKRF